jgi:hypothetical protein
MRSSPAAFKSDQPVFFKSTRACGACQGVLVACAVRLCEERPSGLACEMQPGGQREECQADIAEERRIRLENLLNERTVDKPAS